MKKENFDTDIIFLDDEDDNDFYDEEETVYEIESDTPASTPKQKRSKRRKRKKTKKINLKPINKAAKTGGKLIYRLIGLLLRLITVGLIAYIIYLMGLHFWNGKDAFGSISTILSDKNYVMEAYAGTALLLLMYSVISLFWAFSGPYTKEDNHVRKLDTGRGFLFFIFIYLGAKAASLFGGYIPSSPDFLLGIEGAVLIYGELAATLLPLCAAGIVSSLLRKIIFH